MRLRFIVNPRSGRHRRSAGLLPRIRTFIADRGLDADVVETTGPGHATVLASEAVADGCERVVAVGGDGTMNEVAQALLHTPAALALVPCGSGNGLALHLGLPLAPAAALALAGDPLSLAAVIDTGTANGRPFFNAMGLGLDAEVSRRFNTLTTRGLPAYVRTALGAFLGRSPVACRVTSASGTHAFEALILAVANSDQYGNRALIAPGARVDDGELDLVSVGNVSMPGACLLALRLFTGTIGGSRRVRRLRGTRFVIERPGPGLIHTDGETHEEGPSVEVVVHPRSLRVIVPGGARVLTSTSVPASSFSLRLP